MKYLIVLLVCMTAQTLGEIVREGVSYRDGSGIQMGEETKAAIGLKVVEVKELSTPRSIRLTAQIYREANEIDQNQGASSGLAYASSWIDEDLAEQFPVGTALHIEGIAITTGIVMRVDRTMAGNGGRIEVLIQIHDREQVWRIGGFAVASPIITESKLVTMIPHTAVLETVYGTFVYVVNGTSFLRTAISLGSRYGDYREVVDGLYSGDEVVAHPVETLYLIELRATKGGGHSH